MNTLAERMGIPCVTYGPAESNLGHTDMEFVDRRGLPGCHQGHLGRAPGDKDAARPDRLTRWQDGDERKMARKREKEEHEEEHDACDGDWPPPLLLSCRPYT